MSSLFSGVITFRLHAPTVLPQMAKSVRSKHSIAQRMKETDTAVVLPDRTAPSQMTASYFSRSFSSTHQESTRRCFSLNPLILCNHNPQPF